MYQFDSKFVVMLLLFTLMLVFTFAMPVEASETLADVNGVAITDDDVDKALGAQLVQLQEQMYAMKREQIEILINERLLAHEAAKRRVSITSLLDTEVTGKVPLVTEQEIDSIFRAHNTMFGGEEAKAREHIRAYLQMQKLTAQREAFLRTLKSKASVTVHLKMPPIFRVPVSAEGAPFKGSAMAPVTILKFEDFDCPFCRRVQPILTEILEKYRDKVKLAHRDFPLDELHPEARKTHEATRCAHEQGAFWRYHDVVYSNQPNATLTDLKVYAQKVGLNIIAFEQCLNSGQYQRTVQKDVEEGTRLGLTATPTFFINGRQLSGFQPLEVFVQLIDDELARAQGDLRTE